MVTDASFPVVMPCLSTSKGTSCLDAVFCLLRWGRRICRVGIFPKGFPMPGARGWGPFPSSYRRRPEGYDRASIRPTERKSEKHRRGCGCGECTGPCALHREVHRERERERRKKERETQQSKAKGHRQTYGENPNYSASSFSPESSHYASHWHVHGPRLRGVHRVQHLCYTVLEMGARFLDRRWYCVNDVKSFRTLL